MTREERQEQIEKALIFASLGDADPREDKYLMELLEKYIDGEMELDEIQELLIKKYKEC